MRIILLFLIILSSNTIYSQKSYISLDIGYGDTNIGAYFSGIST